MVQSVWAWRKRKTWRYMGDWQTQRQTDRVVGKQTGRQTDKRRHSDISNYHTLFLSLSTWHITGEKVTFTLQLYVSTWLTIVATVKLLLFNMTGRRKRNIAHSKWDLVGLICKKSFMTVGASYQTIACKMSKHSCAEIFQVHKHDLVWNLSLNSASLAVQWTCQSSTPCINMTYKYKYMMCTTEALLWVVMFFCFGPSVLTLQMCQ